MLENPISKRIIIITFSVSSGIFLVPAFLLLVVRDENSRLIISDTVSPLLNLIATIALSFAGYFSYKNSMRLAVSWWILAMAQLSFTIGDSLWGVYELFNVASPEIPVTDVFYLLYYYL